MTSPKRKFKSFYLSFLAFLNMFLTSSDCQRQGLEKPRKGECEGEKRREEHVHVVTMKQSSDKFPIEIMQL